MALIMCVYRKCGFQVCFIMLERVVVLTNTIKYITAIYHWKDK